MSDILLNAYISYYVSGMKTWSGRSSSSSGGNSGCGGGGGGIIMLAVQPEPSRNEGETSARIISATT